MIEAFVTWVTSLNPAWIFMLFPILFATIPLQYWYERSKQKKLEDHPINMTTVEYQRFNNKRFRQ